jgi:hypothetical protein
MSAGTRATVALLVVGLLALVGAGPASAKKAHRKLLQPLNQYVVSARSTPTSSRARASTSARRR